MILFTLFRIPLRLGLVKETKKNYNDGKRKTERSVSENVSKGSWIMNIFELKFVVQNVVVQLEPEEVIQTVIEVEVPREAQDLLKSCHYLGLAVGMPYGFQLYTKEQWESLKKRVNTFPSIMQRHMKPFFQTVVELEHGEEVFSFPNVITVPVEIGRFAHMEDWPSTENGAAEGLLIITDDNRVFVLRADGKDEFMETMIEQ